MLYLSNAPLNAVTQSLFNLIILISYLLFALPKQLSNELPNTSHPFSLANAKPR